MVFPLLAPFMMAGPAAAAAAAPAAAGAGLAAGGAGLAAGGAGLAAGGAAAFPAALSAPTLPASAMGGYSSLGASGATLPSALYPTAGLPTAAAGGGMGAFGKAALGAGVGSGIGKFLANNMNVQANIPMGRGGSVGVGFNPSANRTNDLMARYMDGRQDQNEDPTSPISPPRNSFSQSLIPNPGMSDPGGYRPMMTRGALPMQPFPGV